MSLANGRTWPRYVGRTVGLGMLLALVVMGSGCTSPKSDKPPELVQTVTEEGKLIHVVEIHITSDHGFVSPQGEKLTKKTIELPPGPTRVKLIYREDPKHDNDEGYTHNFVIVDDGGSKGFRKETGAMNSAHKENTIEFVAGENGITDYIVACAMSCHRMDSLFTRIKVVAKPA